jgi:hypothetical protein
MPEIKTLRPPSQANLSVTDSRLQHFLEIYEAQAQQLARCVQSGHMAMTKLVGPSTDPLEVPHYSLPSSDDPILTQIDMHRDNIGDMLSSLAHLIDRLEKL